MQERAGTATTRRLFVAIVFALTLASAGCANPSIRPHDEPSSATASASKVGEPSATRIFRALRAIEGLPPVAVPVHKSRFSHRGLSGYMAVDDYSDDALAGAIQDKLGIALADDNTLESVAKRIQALGLKIQTPLTATGASTKRFRVQLPQAGVTAIRRFFPLLAGIPGVKFVSPIMVGTVAAVPNDPLLGSQWQIPSINPYTAWDHLQTNPWRLGIVDTGVLATHSDLSGRIVDWYNYPETSPVDASDLNGHGTFVAGLAGAITNNSVGIAGAAWTTSLVVVAANYPRNSSSVASDDVFDAVSWAISHSAKVVNLSLSFPSGDTWQEQILSVAASNNVGLVCASGNSGGTIRYPAAYAWSPTNAGGSPHVIAVGAIDSSNNLASFSSRGDQQSLVAPGVNVFSTARTGGYDSGSGTSYSAPLVSGALTPLWYRCRALPFWAVRDALYASATDLGSSGYDSTFGFGRFNYSAAVDFVLRGGIYQFINQASGIHAWTQDCANQPQPYYEGIAFAASMASLPGTAPFYSVVYPPTGERLLSTASWEGQEAGYHSEGLVGYIGTYPGASGMNNKVYRYEKSTRGYAQGYYFTMAGPTSPFGQILQANGYLYQSILGYGF